MVEAGLHGVLALFGPLCFAGSRFRRFLLYSCWACTQARESYSKPSPSRFGSGTPWRMSMRSLSLQLARSLATCSWTAMRPLSISSAARARSEKARAQSHLVQPQAPGQAGQGALVGVNRNESSLAHAPDCACWRARESSRVERVAQVSLNGARRAGYPVRQQLTGQNRPGCHASPGHLNIQARPCRACAWNH